ncbi:MAG: hypothetical protein ABIR15_08715 [Chitinophagaceae bacterium]
MDKKRCMMDYLVAARALLSVQVYWEIIASLLKLGTFDEHRGNETGFLLFPVI